MSVSKGGERKWSYSLKFIKLSMVEKQKTKKTMIYFCLLLLLKGLVVKYTSYNLLNQKKIVSDIKSTLTFPIQATC